MPRKPRGEQAAKVIPVRLTEGELADIRDIGQHPVYRGWSRSMIIRAAIAHLAMALDEGAGEE